MSDSQRAGNGAPRGDGAERAPAAPGRAPDGPDRAPEIDWIAAERSPEFRELIKRRNAFVIPATIFFLAWFFGFILLAGYAEDFMGESIYEGFTVGYLIALSNFVMVWVLGALYLRQARRVFDPLARKAAEAAVHAGRGTAGTRREEVTS